MDRQSTVYKTYLEILGRELILAMAVRNRKKP